MPLCLDVSLDHRIPNLTFPESQRRHALRINLTDLVQLIGLVGIVWHHLSKNVRSWKVNPVVYSDSW